jgi:hypothetical protein
VLICASGTRRSRRQGAPPPDSHPRYPGPVAQGRTDTLPSDPAGPTLGARPLLPRAPACSRSGPCSDLGRREHTVRAWPGPVGSSAGLRALVDVVDVVARPRRDKSRFGSPISDLTLFFLCVVIEIPFLPRTFGLQAQFFIPPLALRPLLESRRQSTSLRALSNTPICLLDIHLRILSHRPARSANPHSHALIARSGTSTASLFSLSPASCLRLVFPKPSIPVFGCPGPLLSQLPSTSLDVATLATGSRSEARIPCRNDERTIGLQRVTQAPAMQLRLSRARISSRRGR